MTMQHQPAKGGFFHSVAGQILLFGGAIVIVVLAWKYAF
jgi:hypothetical protein